MFGDLPNTLNLIRILYKQLTTREKKETQTSVILSSQTLQDTPTYSVLFMNIIISSNEYNKYILYLKYGLGAWTLYSCHLIINLQIFSFTN